MQSPITLSGNLTDDPVCKIFKTGSTLTKFRLASSRRVRTDSTTADGRPVWADADSLFIDVECWGQLAVNVEASLRKGLPAVVVGRLVTETWVDEGGTKRSKQLIKAAQVALELNRYQASSKCTTAKEHTAGDIPSVNLRTREDIAGEIGETPTNPPTSQPTNQPTAQPEPPSYDDEALESLMNRGPSDMGEHAPEEETVGAA